VEQAYARVQQKTPAASVLLKLMVGPATPASGRKRAALGTLLWRAKRWIDSPGGPVVRVTYLAGTNSTSGSFAPATSEDEEWVRAFVGTASSVIGKSYRYLSLTPVELNLAT
jgi:hypothetical protein